MANEAVIVELLGQPKGKPISFTIPDNVGIAKGTLLWYGDNRTASGASVVLPVTKPFAGIASTEKVANDGSTHIGCWTCGIFDLTSNAVTTITAGNPVVISGQNLISPSLVLGAGSGAHIVGYALEDASASEVIQVAVGLK